MIPVNRPLIDDSDLKAVTIALQETWISGETPPVRELEKSLSDLLGVSHTVAVSTGTTALDLAIDSLGIQKGDECIVPTFTIISTVSNLLRRGASVTFIDSDSETWCMDANQTVESITQKTKLIIPVHIYGLPVDMDPIMLSANKVGAFVLEDAAEALGMRYKDRTVGSLGHAAIFSFYANKVITGGEGGALSTSNSDFAERAKFLRNLCFQPDARFVHNELGWNYRMSGLVASLINSQLKRINELVRLKIKIGTRYRVGLDGHPWIEFPLELNQNSQNNYWVFGMLLNEDCPFGAGTLQAILKERGVESRRFFFPLHMQPLSEIRDLQIKGEFPVAERLWERGLYLPSGLGNTFSEIDQVIEILWSLV